MDEMLQAVIPGISRSLMIESRADRLAEDPGSGVAAGSAGAQRRRAVDDVKSERRAQPDTRDPCSGMNVPHLSDLCLARLAKPRRCRSAASDTPACLREDIQELLTLLSR